MGVHEEGVAAPVVGVVVDAEDDAAVGVVEHRVALAVEQQRLAPNCQPPRRRRRHRRRSARLRPRLHYSIARVQGRSFCAAYSGPRPFYIPRLARDVCVCVNINIQLPA